MTLLEYAYGCYDAFKAAKPYMEFKTFVESLERKSNKSLIESISNGVSVIIEAHLGIDAGKVRNNKEEFKKLIDSKDKRAILGYALPIIYATIQNSKESESRTEAKLTNAINWFTDNWEKLLNYKPTFTPSAYINSLLRNVENETRSQFNTVAVLIDSPHQECNATFEKNWDSISGGDNEVPFHKVKNDLTVYGKIMNPKISPDQTIEVQWVRGPNANTTTVEDYYDLVFFDLSDDPSKTISASTPLDKDKDTGGQQEDLSHTAAFADKSADEDMFGPEIAKDIDDAISIVTDVYEENGFQNIESLKALIHDGLVALLNKQIRAKVAKDINNLENNWKQAKTEEEKQAKKAEAEKQIPIYQAELAKLDEIRANGPDKSTFGQKHGIKSQVAKKAWGEFVEVLKHQPTILKWINSHR